MAAGHGHITQFLHPGAYLHFMGRVAHRKGGGYRKGRDAARVLGNGGAAGRFVQRVHGHTPRIMAAGQTFDRFHTQQIQQPAGLDLMHVIAQEQGAHG